MPSASSGGLQQDCTAIMQAIGRNLAPFLHRKHNTEKRSSNEAFIFSKHYNNDSLGAARFFFFQEIAGEFKKDRVSGNL